jgi:choline kinase
MRAILLSAGRGRRLLPLTDSLPKCLLPVVGETTALEYQLQKLAASGVDHATIMVGFGAEKVERALAERPVPGIEAKTVYNPFYAATDNLVTVWLAQTEMTDDFMLLNGDTMFEAEVARRLIASPRAPLTLAINRKESYDSDDMKVSLNGGRRLTAVSKSLSLELVDGESIGFMLFRDDGVKALRDALNAAVRAPEALKAWYLSVVDGLAGSMRVETMTISDLWWAEIDCAKDLREVRAALEEREAKEPTPVYARPSRAFAR